MFLESLMDSCDRSGPRRRWATLISFGLQTVCVGALVLAPLLYTGALPPLTFSPPLLPPPAHRRAQVKPQDAVKLIPVPTNLTADGGVRAPIRIPDQVWIPATPEPAAPPAGLLSALPGVEGGTGPDLVTNPMIAEVVRSRVATPPPLQRLVISAGVQQALLLHRVTPQYPPIAVQAHIQGTVVLHAIITRQGTIERLDLVNGHPLLAPAAIDAVRQWRYRPTYLNHEPVEVETEIVINFVLGRG